MNGEATNSAVAQHVDFCVYAIDAALRALDEVTGQPDEQPHVLALGLYATILELGAGALTLAQTRRYAGLPILIRSMYEAHLDLQNLLCDVDYALNIEAADAEQQLKLMMEARTNPCLSGASFDAPAEAKRLRERLDELRRQGHPPLTIKERATRLGRAEQHAVAYALLCLDGHNNASALADRHFSEVDGRRVVTFFGEPYLPSLRARMYWLILFLVESTTALHIAFRSESASARELQKRFAAEQESLIAIAR